MTDLRTTPRSVLVRRGVALEYATLGWNVIGIVVLAVAAVSARSVALAGFGLDSLIEIGASTVVIWELSGTGEDRQRRALRLIGVGFALLAVYLLVQSTLGAGHRLPPAPLAAGHRLDRGHRRRDVRPGRGKARTGAALDNPVLKTEGRVTLIDGLLAAAVLLGLLLNAWPGCGGPTRPPATCWSTTRSARSGRSSPITADRPSRARPCRMTCTGEVFGQHTAGARPPEPTSSSWSARARRRPRGRAGLVVEPNRGTPASPKFPHSRPHQAHLGRLFRRSSPMEASPDGPRRVVRGRRTDRRRRGQRCGGLAPADRAHPHPRTGVVPGGSRHRLRCVPVLDARIGDGHPGRGDRRPGRAALRRWHEHRLAAVPHDCRGHRLDRRRGHLPHRRRRDRRRPLAGRIRLAGCAAAGCGPVADRPGCGLLGAGPPGDQRAQRDPVWKASPVPTTLLASP